MSKFIKGQKIRIHYDHDYKLEILDVDIVYQQYQVQYNSAPMTKPWLITDPPIWLDMCNVDRDCELIPGENGLVGKKIKLKEDYFFIQTKIPRGSVGIISLVTSTSTGEIMYAVTNLKEIEHISSIIYLKDSEVIVMNDNNLVEKLNNSYGCSCGAWKCGYIKASRSHSNWCKLYKE